MKKTNSIRFFIMGLFTALFLTSSVVAAEAESKQPSLPEKDIIFVAKSIVIDSDYTPEGKNNVDVIMKPTPVQRLQEKLSDNFFVTTTGSNTLKITITSASITEEHIKSDSFFKRGTFKYVANFSVRIQMLNANGKTIANSISKSWGTRTVSDGTSIKEREDSISEMTDKLIANLVDQVRTEAESGFKQYVKTKI